MYTGGIVDGLNVEHSSPSNVLFQFLDRHHYRALKPRQETFTNFFN